MYFLDLETGGFDPKKYGILQVGLIKIDSNKIVDKWNSWIKPYKPIKLENLEFVGVTMDFLEKNGEDYNKVMAGMKKLIGPEDVIGGHNIEFDLRFLPFYVNNHICTYKIAKDSLNLDSYKLGDVCDHLKVPYGEHDALADAISSFECYKKMIWK